jgi:hypothetical protein
VSLRRAALVLSTALALANRAGHAEEARKSVKPRWPDHRMRRPPKCRPLVFREMDAVDFSASIFLSEKLK